MGATVCWERPVRVEHAPLGAADDGRFWMLYKDFFQFFYCVTINYTRDDYYLIRIAEEVPDETWGVSRIVLPQDSDSVFFSIF